MPMRQADDTDANSNCAHDVAASASVVAALLPMELLQLLLAIRVSLTWFVAVSCYKHSNYSWWHFLLATCHAADAWYGPRSKHGWNIITI